MRIGIDLGGTKIEGLALADDGRELARRRVPAPRGDYGRTLLAIADLVSLLERDVGESGRVGVGMPGTISPATGLVKNANSTWLNGRPLGDDLPRLLDRPVRFANDANCFALSEASDGAAAGAAVVFGVILGTGTGGGVVVNGRVLVDCGRRGCIETFLSGPALARDYAQAAPEAETPLTAADDAERARAREPRAVARLDRYVDRLARALASVINVLDPDVIVLGGGVSNIDALYDAVPDRWARYVFSDRVDTRLVRAQHGDASGVRGAAWL
jgi:fructokinase